MNATAIAAVDAIWSKLKPEVGYLTEEEVKRIEFGLEVAYMAHDGQYRKSGEPFIIHPAAVGALLAGLKVDCDTVLAGLLHDTVEDTELTFLQVELMFGPTVRRIVEGETKVSKLPKIALGRGGEEGGGDLDEQAENLRQMFIAMSADYRIIIVKLADRLHNMRTLNHMPPHKQQRISRETIEIFAPLAHRLGIWNFKSELEDLSFQYLHPAEYRALKQQLSSNQYKESLERSKSSLEAALHQDAILLEQKVDVTVTGRLKELYPLWMKMEGKNESKLPADVVALRVILDPARGWDEPEDEWKTRGVWLCYHVLGLIQHLQADSDNSAALPSRQVKDYISFPKPNGYQSLHTAIDTNGQTVEVQIRTTWMHSVAEYGLAAHWLYKEDRYGTGNSIFNRYQVAWMETIKEWQDEINNSTEFVEAIRRELLGKRVFIFLRDGKILNLSRGATVIDASFAIHSEVGLKMTAAKINGQDVPLSYTLQNGDVVSIDTSPEGRPSLDWMHFAKSRSTRARLRTYFRGQQRIAYVQKGFIIIRDFMTQHAPLIRFRHGDVDATYKDDGELRVLMRRFCPDPDDFCVSLAQMGNQAVVRATLSQLLSLRFDQVEASAEAIQRALKKAPSKAQGLSTPLTSPSSGELVGPETKNVAKGTSVVNTAQPCPICMPVLGDSVVGCSDESGTVIAHLPSCSETRRAEETCAATLEAGDFVSELQVYCTDRKYLLRDVSEVVSSEAEIVGTSSQTIEDIALLCYKVEVPNLQQLQTLMNAICAVPGVKSCERVTSS